MNQAVPTVSIVIPTLNQISTIGACLDAIFEHTIYPSFEVIVVDGGSKDGTLELLQARTDIRLIEHGQRGITAALNRAFAQAGSNDIVRLHGDVILETRGWLTQLVTFAQSLPKPAIVGAKLVLSDDRIQAVGRSIISGLGIWERHANRKCFELDAPKKKESDDDAVEVDSVAGALAYYPRQILNATGGLDESYWPQYLDDDDFCLMARHQGYKVYVLPTVKAWHATSTWGPTAGMPVHDPHGIVPKILSLRKAMIDSQCDHFAEKWGFDPRFPDVAEIRRLYGETEICWRIGEPMRFEPKAWPPAVDAVMVTWNSLPKLKRCLESLARTRYTNLRVHIANNASTDGTKEYLDALQGTFPFELNVHHLAVNSGVAVGFNWAITQGDGELVARLDDDVELPPEWLEVLVEDFRRRPYAGCVGPKILNDNPQRDIQCTTYRMFPCVYGNDGEDDHGQADFLARTVHVRGCCNLYRRDVLEDVGLFDLRFSPSQFDDPDHHIALAASGYEVLYDGRVGVIHSLTSGLGKSYAAITNQNANREKLFGKWGHDVWMVLDRSLDLSTEGRLIPLVEDPRFFEQLPDQSEFPRIVLRRAEADRRSKILKVDESRRELLKSNGELAQIWEDTIDLARARIRDGFFRHAEMTLLQHLELQPGSAKAMRMLAEVQIRLGEPDRVEAMMRRARRIDASSLAFDSGRGPGLVTLEDAQRLMAEQAGAVSRTGTADRSSDIGETSLDNACVEVVTRMKVLICNTYQPRVAGGDMHQMKKLAQHLRRLGATVDFAYVNHPDPTGYDVVHVVNLWFPNQTLPQVKGIRRQRPDVPIVMTPIYWDMAEKHWADHVVPTSFMSSRSEDELLQRLALLGQDELKWNGRRRREATEPNFRGYCDYQRQILDRIDWLLPQSELEMENLEKTLEMSLPYTVVRNAAEPAVFDAATPDAFVQKYGVEDFVITVGLVENRKNQALLLYAMRSLGIPVVVVGRHYDPYYMRVCRDIAPKNTLFIEHMPHEMLASALKAARVFALPSWMECASFAMIEAALAGCGLVVSDRTSEPEYFGNNAYYCDPANVISIRDSVVRAFTNYDRDSDKRAALHQRFTQDWTWEEAARQTIVGYENAIAARAGGQLIGASRGGQKGIWDLGTPS
ncbi:MAG: glycosyltransferase [Planctomycetota bacterium]